MTQILPLDSEANTREAIARIVASAWPSYHVENIAFAPVALETVKPLSATVQQRRLARTHSLLSEMQRAGIKSFTAMAAHQPRARDPWRLILPPVVEAHGGLHIIIDGVHRIHTARRTLASAQLLIVSNVPEPLPCTVKEWAELNTVTRYLPPEEMIGRHDPLLLRPVARQLAKLRFKTKHDLDRFMATWCT
jgi:hypothetical protein